MESRECHDREEIRKELEPVFEQLIDAVAGFVEETDGLGDVDFESFEQYLDDQGDELKRRACKRALEACEPDDDEVLIDGQRWYQCMKSSTTYASKWGEIELERGLFRRRGEHNGPTVAPMELQAGIVEGRWTPCCARKIAEFVQELPGHRAAELSGLGYSSTSFKRLGKTLGESWESERREVERVTTSQIDVPDDAESMSVLADRVSVLMREEDGHNWRMLWCGAVCLHDAEGETIKTLRYGAIPERVDEALKEPMRRDVEAILEDAPQLDCIALGDGGKDICKFLDEEFPEFDRRIDLMHLVEKIGKALKLWATGRPTTFDDPSTVVEKWKLQLLNDDEAIESIEDSLQSFQDTELEDETAEAIDAALTYIGNHREQMRYASVRARGLPVGSGAVEATCKSLVALRMKRNGQSWSYSGAQAILNLRSLALSDRWEEGMDALMDRYREPVTSVAHAA